MLPRSTRRAGVIASAILGAAVAAAAVTVTAMATTSQRVATITTVAGSLSCPADASRAGSFTLPSVANGTYDNGWLAVSNASSTSFDWAFTQAGIGAINMAVVIVQGGGNSAVYTYDYLGGGYEDSGSGLAAPGGSAITKVEFCFDDKVLRDIIEAGGGASGGGPADLAVTGVVSPTIAKVGDTIVWRLNVLDKNKAPATGLKLSIALTGGVEYASSQSDRGAGCKPDSPTRVTCDLDFLSADSPIGSVVLLTRVVRTGQHSLTVVASHSQPDAQPSDNTLELTASTPAPRAPTGGSAGAALTIKAGTATIRSVGVANGRVTFRTTLRLSKPSKLAVTVMDQPAQKRLTILAGSSLGKTKSSRAGRVLSAATSRATTVRVVVVVPLAQLVRGHRVVLVVNGTSTAGKGARMTIPLSW